MAVLFWICISRLDGIFRGKTLSICNELSFRSLRFSGVTWWLLGSGTGLLTWDTGVSKCGFCFQGLTVEQSETDLLTKWVWGLVWFGVPVRVNSKFLCHILSVLLKIVNFAYCSSSCAFYPCFVCFVFAASNCRHITNTKSKENVYFIIEKKKLFALQCHVAL